MNVCDLNCLGPSRAFQVRPFRETACTKQCRRWLYLLYRMKKIGVFCTLTLAWTLSGQPVAESSTNVIEARDVSWKRLVPNILDDQKHIWLFPTQVVRGRHLLPAIGVLGATAALVVFDPVEARYFRRTTSFHALNTGFSSYATTGEILAVPVAFYVTGLLTKDSNLQQTALFAGEALADVEIPTLIMRNSFRRLRPADVPPGGNFNDTWFDSGANPLKAKGSFPSGHAAAAFAVATVVARRYPHRRWVPYVAYGAAALISFSRMTDQAHFSSDVFFGGALGYAVGRFGVLHQ